MGILLSVFPPRRLRKAKTETQVTRPNDNTFTQKCQGKRRPRPKSSTLRNGTTRSDGGAYTRSDGGGCAIASSAGWFYFFCCGSAKEALTDIYLISSKFRATITGRAYKCAPRSASRWKVGAR